VKAYSDKDIWLMIILSKYKELQKELIWSNALASGDIIQANTQLIWLDQEILLLTKEIELLDIEEKKLLAELNSDQSLRLFDLQKMIIESQAEILKAQAQLQANQSAIWVIQSTVKSTVVIAPFAWTISRKNVVVWQSVDTGTPIFDIVWLETNSDSFVRFEVPVAEFARIKKWIDLQISLPWSSNITNANVARIAQSVNQNNQTITVEGIMDTWNILPLWTNVRVSGQGLSWESIIWIPNSAVFALEDGSRIIYKVLSNNTLRKQQIIVVSQDADMSYIQWELSINDTVVLHADDPQWSDGEVLEVKKESSSTQIHEDNDSHASH
jgi:hypothetical protein